MATCEIIHRALSDFGYQSVITKHECHWYWRMKGCYRHVGRECAACFGPHSESKKQVFFEVMRVVQGSPTCSMDVGFDVFNGCWSL